MRLILLLLTMTAGWSLMPVMADPPDISEKSPDGKWEFNARWHVKGYLWELRDVTSGKAYLVQPEPGPDEALPHRLSVLWSPGHRYLALNVYYGRIVYGIDVIRLTTPPTDQVECPEPPELDMIRSEDRKLWSGDGAINRNALRWEDGDVLVVGLDMKSQLSDKSAGTTYRIFSQKQQAIHFDDLKGTIVRDDAPDYEKNPIQ